MTSEKTFTDLDRRQREYCRSLGCVDCKSWHPVDSAFQSLNSEIRVSTNRQSDLTLVSLSSPQLRRLPCGVSAQRCAFLPPVP